MPYRPIFTGLALGSLGYAFYLNYIKYRSPRSSKMLFWFSMAVTAALLLKMYLI